MVTRYEVIGTCGGSCHDIEPHPQGDWVSYDDYEDLIVENDALKSELEYWKFQHQHK